MGRVRPYSPATDERYAMGLLAVPLPICLTPPAGAGAAPVFTTTTSARYSARPQPFHRAAGGVTDLLVYHARNYTQIEGDPLWNPDRHTCIQPLQWDADGMPVFGRPLREVEIPGAGA